MSQRYSLSISIDKDIDLFLRKCTDKVIEIGNEKINIHKSKNELYNDALKYALEHADDWLFKKNED